MSAITNAELPVFTTVEEVAVWALELLSYLSPVKKIKTDDGEGQVYFTRATGIAADGQTIFYGSLIIPLNADFAIANGKIWKKCQPVESITVPAAFKVN
jgi:hypothetical protein